MRSMTLFHAGLRREEIWITSKLWNDKQVKTT